MADLARGGAGRLAPTQSPARALSVGSDDLLAGRPTGRQRQKQRSLADRADRSAVTALPQWVRPQLTELVDAPPDGDQWLHEIKYDGYRMHACLDRGAVKLLTRTGLDWTHKYPGVAGDFLRNQLSAHCNGHPTEIENGGRSK